VQYDRCASARWTQIDRHLRARKLDRLTELGTLLLVPSNNGLPASKAAVVDASRHEVVQATRHAAWVVRADVAGASEELVFYGSSAVVAPGGQVVAAAMISTSHLLVADLRARALSVKGPLQPTSGAWVRLLRETARRSRLSGRTLDR
jgi:predicted amidohydrolase